MERDIDMGQTIEDAAKEYSSQFPWGEDDKIASLICENDFKRGFKAGAEWQAKQSPWVSIKERLPKENEMVLCRMVSNGAIVSGYIVVEAGKPPRVATSGNFEFEDYGDYECDMWMPIPDLEE